MKKILLKILVLYMAICAVLCVFTACDGQNSSTPSSQSQTGTGINSGTRPEGTKELKVTTNIPEGATVSGSGYYKYNDNIHATAQIKDGYMFLGWYVNDDDCVSNQTEYNGKMWNQDVEFSAKVIKIPDNVAQSSTQQSTNKNYTLTVETVDANYGLVSLDNQSNQEKYTESYRQGQSFKVLAYSKTSDRFVGWYGLSGELITTNATFTMTMPYFDYMLVAVWGNTDRQWDGEKFFYKPVSGGYALMDYKGEKSSITIPLTYKGKPVIEIEGNCFAENNTITEITLSENINRIGDGALSNCASLNVVNVSENNKFYKSVDGNLYSKNGESIYWVSKNITQFAIPNGLTNIGRNTFSGCSALSKIYYSGNVNGWVQISGLENLMKYGSQYKSLYINNVLLTEAAFDSINEIPSYAFYNCSSLRNITIPDSVNDIGEYAFSGCSIENAKIPAVAIERLPKNYLKTVEITSGESIESQAFYNCYSLTSITIPNTITSVGEWAFYGCGKLQNIYYKGTIQEWASKIDGIFNLWNTGRNIYVNNELLKDITELDLGNITEIKRDAFTGCSKLQVLQIPKSVKSIGNAFGGCENLTRVNYEGDIAGWCNIDLDSGNPLEYAHNLYVKASDGYELVTDLVITDTVKQIKSYSFYGCSLTSVKV